MQIKLEDIVNSNKSLGNVINEKMNVKLAFKFRKVIKVVEENIDLFNKTKESIVKNNELETDETGKILIPKEKEDKVNNDFKELLEQKVEFTPEIEIDELECLRISPNDLNNIAWCIKGA